MKTTLKKSLALLLALVMCVSLLPMTALADLPTITIDPGTIALVGGSAPSLSMGWSYSSAVPSNCMVEVYAWAGTGDMPEAGWLMTVGDNTLTSTDGSYAGRLASFGSNPAALTGTCTVMVEVISGNESKYSSPVTVTAMPEVKPTITSAAYDPVSTVLTASFSTTDVYAQYYESYLLTKKTLMDKYSQGTMTFGGETYYVWGSMSFDPSDSAHVTVDSSAGTVTLSQDLYFKGEDNYFTYPAPDDEVFVVVETDGLGKSDSAWSLTVPETGSPGRVTATLDSIEAGTMTTDFGTEITGNIATISVTMEVEDGVKGLFVAPFNSQDFKASTGNMPSIHIAHQYNSETHTFDLVGTWEGTSEGADIETGPNGEKITASGSTVTIPIKVAQSSEASGKEVVFAEGDTIVIYARKTTRNGTVATDEVKLEIPFSTSSIGQTVVVDDEPSPTITTTSLPNGSTLRSYSATLAGTAVNGGTLSWSATGLPGGLTLNRSTGAITGTPTASGDFNVVVTLTEKDVAKTASKTLKLTVTGAAPTINTATLANATWGLDYSATLTGTAANSGALSWELETGSTLPTGLTLAENGRITGTPAQDTQGDYSFTVKLNEANNNQSTTKTLTMKVSAPAAPKINVTTLPNATWHKPYTIQLNGTASIRGTLSWSLAAGSDALPNGLTLNESTGEIKGTPTPDQNSGTTGGSTGGNALQTGSTGGATTSGGRSVSLNATGSGGTDSGSGGTDSGSGSGASGGGAIGTESKTYHLKLQLTETKTVGEQTFTLTSEVKDLSLTVNPPQYFTVTYYLNGGTGENPADYEKKTNIVEGSEIELPAAVTRTGYNFQGWNINGKTYSAGESVEVNSNLNVFAHFEAKPATKVVYTGPQLLDSAYLVGTYTYGDSNQHTATVTLDSDYSRTLFTPQLSIEAYELNRNYTGFSLYTYVDGVYTEVAKYSDDIAEGTESVTLTTVAGLSLTEVNAVTATGLTSGTDYSVGSVRAIKGGSTYYGSLPFLTDGTASFQVELNGVSSSDKYDKYQWTTYDATLDGSTLSVTPTTVPDGISISGTVTFGGQPMAGVQVLIHQYSYVYGQDRNRIAVTDSKGEYTVEGILENVNATIQVLSGGQSLYSKNFNPIKDVEENIAVNRAAVRISTELDLSASVDGLTDAQRSFVQRELGWKWVDIAFTDNGDANKKSSGTFWLNDAQYCYAEATAQNSLLQYSITNSTYFDDALGSVQLKDGFGSAAVKLQPRAAVLATITAPAYGGFYLAWFDSTGAYKGAQLVSLSKGTQTYLAPCPGDPGSYTLALLSGARYDVLTSNTKLADIPAAEMPLTWSVSLAAHEIKTVSGTVSQAASDNALYVTKPNSTMTADRESFATEGDLVRFTGAIGLDDDLSGGKLQTVYLYPKNEADNISYSNSAPVQYMVINGKLYDASEASMASTGYYTFNVSGDNIELPCTYTLYCKPGHLDWDMQMKMYVNVTYSGGSKSEQLVGSATVKKPGASITTLSTSVCSDLVYVNGAAAPNTTVSIYDGETLVGTATANKKGLWGAKVPLANTDSEYASTHVLTSRTDKARSEDLYVFHDPDGPELTSFRMSWKEYGRDYSINVGEGYTYHGRMEEVTFTAVFKNPNKLRATVYSDANETSKVAFVYYLTNGTIATVYGSEQGGGVFTATLPNTLYSSVAAAEVLFDPILNNRPVSADGSTHALTDTDLAEYADVLDAAKNAMETVNGTNQDRTYDPATLATINSVYYTGTDMTVQALAVKYDDNTGFLQWMNESAADWTSGNLEAHSVGIYNKSVVFAKKADFDAQLAQLKAYATWKSDLENSSSTVTASQLFFTDMKYDGDLNLTDKGTYFAEFNAFSDTGRELYAIIGALSLDSSFQHYATNLPNNVAATTAWSGSSIGNATLTRFWGNETSKDNVSTTEKALMKYAEGGGIEKLFSIGPPNPVDIYYDIKNNSTEYINTTTNSEMQALGARVDSHNIENSKEWQEINNAKDYYDRINPYSSFRSTPYDDDTPTIGDRIDQIKKDIEALRDVDGKLPYMDAKYAMEMMKSLKDVADLAGFLAGGGADLNPASPFFKFLQDVPGLICDKMTMDQIQERMDIYARMMYNWNYVQNWYNSEIGFGDERFAPKENNGGGDTGGGGGTGGGGTGGGGTGGSGGGQKDDTGTSSAKRARDIADQSKTRKPPITNKVSNDPSGIVFEGVIENPVKDATVTLYYAANNGGDVVLEKDVATATKLLQAEGVDGLIPAASTQVTGDDGRYAWGVPEGLWYVTAQWGGLAGNSNADKAATVAKDLMLGNTAVNNLLPVLPVQLDVHIPLTDVTAPVVSDVVYAEKDGIYVTFSKYMDEATCLSAAYYAVSVNGTPDTTFTVAAVDRGTYPSNLTDVETHYTKTVFIDAYFLAGDTVSLTVKKEVESYAGTPMEADYENGALVESQEPLGQPSLKVGSATGEEVLNTTLAIARGSALFLGLPTSEGTPNTASVKYQIDNGTVKTFDQASPIVVSNDMTLKFWTYAPGYPDSEPRTVTIKCSSILPTITADKSSVSVTAGSTATFTVTLLDATGQAMAGKTVNVTSANPAVATVTASAVTDASGKATFTITGVAAGSTALNITAENVDASLGVTVTSGDTGTFSGGGGGGGANTYAPTIAESANGKVTTEPAKAAKGDTVKITVTPDTGYEVDTLTVTDADGKEVTVTKNADGTFSFVQPDGKVTITATFKKSSASETRPFTDVKETDWFYDAVYYCFDAGYFKGVSETEFDPQGTMTRAMFATVLWRVAGQPAATGGKAFDDVEDGKWYTDAILWASGEGILDGYGDGTFGTNDPVTREQMVTLLWRYSGKPAGTADLSGYTDADEISDWAREAFAWAIGIGLVQGKGESVLDPGGKATRAEVATLMQRMNGLIAQ